MKQPEPQLSKAQQNILTNLSTSYQTGLSQKVVSTRRNGEFNELSPPINCPKWACILLPCIKYIPSMKLYETIQPSDAEILRDGEWICYDAYSLVQGDIIRLTEGDVIPADCCLLSLGLDRYGDGYDVDGGQDEFIVDASNITGRVQPITINEDTFLQQLQEDDGDDEKEENNEDDSLIHLHCGSFILNGSAIAVVTNVGSNTFVAKQMKNGKWPPAVSSGDYNMIQAEEDGDAEEIAFTSNGQTGESGIQMSQVV